MMVQLSFSSRDKDYVAKSEKITRTQDILFELMAALNMEAGSIAINLKSLYMYMVKRLFDANFKNDLHAIEESIKIMSELRESWEKIVSKPEHKNTTESKNSIAQQAQMVHI